MTAYLGIDYGTKNLGFALGETSLATPLGSLKYENDEKALSYINTLIVKYSVEKIVIGLPEGIINSKAQHFGHFLETKLSLPVIYHPETLSTHDAKTALLATGSRTKRQNDHTYAACLILEDYLDMLN